MRRPLFFRALLAAGLAWAVACSPGDPARRFPEVAHDLAALFPAAEAHREVAAVDFGTPSARPHLARGWYRHSRPGPGGETWARNDAPESTLHFWLAAPRPLRAELRGGALGPAPVAVQVAVNGRELPPLKLAPGLHDHAVEIPAEALAAGRNELTLRVAEPATALWDRLAFRPALAAEAPRARAGGEGRPATLEIPAGSEVVFHLDLAGPSALTWDGLAIEGAGELLVLARPEGGPEAMLARRDDNDRDGGPGAVEIPGAGPRLVRLTLRAAPADPERPRPATVTLEAPLVRSAPSPREGAPTPPAPKTPEAPAPGSDLPPNVVVYLVDTLRADRLGAYGGPPELSPRIDAFAREAVVFENAVAQAPWTRPSVASLFTGLGPPEHGVKSLDDRLPEEAVTLAEILRDAGYRTAAFSTNWHVAAPTGLDQGFEDFQFFPDDPGSDAVNRRVLSWLDGGGRPDFFLEEPFFLYVHALDPHAPYEPPAEYRARFAPGVSPEVGSREDLQRVYALSPAEREREMPALRALYDAEVAANDARFGELLDALKQRGLYARTLIVFLSDHGEALGERGHLGHANSLFAEELDIPLIVKPPAGSAPGPSRPSGSSGSGGRRSADLAQHLDLLPTVLRAAGVEAPPGLPGRDLLGPLPSGEPRAFSHLSYNGREGVSVVQDGWKRILPLSRRFGRLPLLFHRPEDPRELRDLSAERPVRAGFLDALLRAERHRARAAPPADRAEMDEETRKGLEALGYL